MRAYSCQARSASPYDGLSPLTTGRRTGRRTVVSSRRAVSAYGGFSPAATICLRVRRAASACGDLSPRTTGRRKVATDRRSRRQTVARGEKASSRCGGGARGGKGFSGGRGRLPGIGRAAVGGGGGRGGGG